MVVEEGGLAVVLVLEALVLDLIESDVLEGLVDSVGLVGVTVVLAVVELIFLFFEEVVLVTT